MGRNYLCYAAVQKDFVRKKKSVCELYCLYSVRIPSSHPTQGNEKTKADFYCDFFFKKCSSKHKHRERVKQRVCSVCF